MISTLESQAMQYLSTRSKQSVHAIRLELIDILDEKKSLEEGLSNAVKQCERMLQSDDLKSYVVLQEYASLLRDLLKNFDSESTIGESTSKLEILVRGLNPFAFALQSLEGTADLQRKGQNPLCYPANELRKQFNKPLTYPAFSRSIFENFLSNTDTCFWKSIQSLNEALSVSVSSLLVVIERFHSQGVMYSDSAGSEERIRQFRADVSVCVQQVLAQLDESNSIEIDSADDEAVVFLRDVFDLIAGWLNLLASRKLSAVQNKSGCELIKTLTRCRDENFSSLFRDSLLDFVYLISPALERSTFKDTVSNNEILSTLGITQVEKKSINKEWKAYGESSLNLSIPDLDAINALAESITDCIQSIKESVADIDMDSLTYEQGDEANEQLICTLENKLLQIEAVAKFVPHQCSGSIAAEIDAALSYCVQLHDNFDEVGISRFADSLLAIESSIDGLLEVNQSDSSMAALFVQVKALINQLEVSYRRCAQLSVCETLEPQGEQFANELEKLSISSKTLNGVAGFIADPGLKDTIAKIASAVNRRFDSNDTSVAETNHKEEYDALMLECIERAQIYTESLLKPGHSASIETASNNLLEVVQSLHFSNESPITKDSTHEHEPTNIGEKGSVSKAESIEVDEPNSSEDAHQYDKEKSEPAENNKLVDEIDDEIAEIFLEEAEEVLAELESLGEAIGAKQSLTPDQQTEWESLKECRRFFHTLKGSGRMASAVHLGEFSWALESMLNRILEGSINCESEHIFTINAAIEELPKLLNAFRLREHPGSGYLAIEENAQALTEGKTIELAAESEQAQETVEVEQPEQLDQNIGLAKSLELSVEEPEPAVDLRDKEEASCSGEEVEPIEKGLGQEEIIHEEHHEEHIEEPKTEIAPTEQELVEDPQEIFASELLATVASLRELLHDAVNSEKGSQSLLKAAVIKMHGLSGSAKLIDYQDAARVAQIAETHLEVLTGLDDTNNSVANLIESYCDLLDKLATLETPHAEIVQEALKLKDSFEQGAELELEKQSVRETIQACRLLFDFEVVIDSWRVSKAEGQLYDLLVCELGMLREAFGLPTGLLQLIDKLGRVYSLVEGRALNYVLHGILIKAHEELESGLGAVITEQEQSKPKSLVALNELLTQLENDQKKLRTYETGPVDSNEEGEQLASSPALESEDVDQEILAIFLEELDELEEDLTSRISAWREEPDNLILMEALLRPLHTLKGSARMAGVQTLANEAHALESNIQALLENQSSDSVQALEIFETRFAELLTLCKQTEQLRKDDQCKAQTKFIERRSKDRAPAQASNQMLRLPASMVERLCNLAAENNVSRAIIDQHISDFGYGFEEIESTLTRLGEQIRRLEIEAEAQIEFGRERAEHEELKDFDPLEMDRYSKLQQISRSLVESCSDLRDLHGTLKDNARSVETVLIQHSRIGRELHIALQQTRTVPLSKVLIPRVRKTLSALSKELEKPVSLSVLKVDGELDRNVIERLTGPIEHILRNAIDHGLESEQERLKNGKSAKGLICLDVFREGSELVIEIKDDGKGIDVDAVRKKAEQRGIINTDETVTDEEVMQAIFEPGFSTAGKITQISGRGVGLDVVSSEIAGMGGSVRVHSKQGEGTMFKLRLPFKVAMSRALLVTAANETFAIPIDSIVGVVRVSSFELEEQYHSDQPKMVYANQEYDFHYLGKLLMGAEPEYNLEQFAALPVLLARMEDQMVAIQVDNLLGSREVTVKTLSQKFSAIFGVSGATILGNGKVVTILDLPELVGKKSISPLRSSTINAEKPFEKKLPDNSAVRALVVDDSVTVRKVTSRLLERQDIDVQLAKDGQDALEQLENSTPDFVLLDIEMPRIDGFEVLERMSRDDRLSNIPVIIISSRSGEKHQLRASELGASAFLGKPYQDAHLLEVIAQHCPRVADRDVPNTWSSPRVING